MFESHLEKRGSFKRTLSGQPFVGNDSERVLITCLTRFALNLLWGNVAAGASHFLGDKGERTTSHDGKAKITQQDFVVSPEQHIIRLDVPMDQFLVVGI